MLHMAKTRSEINNAYAKKAYDDIRLQVPKGQKDVIKAHADSMGETIGGFIKRAIQAQMDRDKVDRWISVKDRLPETDAWVAVWYRDKDGDCFPTVGQYRDFAGQKYWTTDVDDNERAYPPEEITHWMPLPGPLEADDHN